MPTLRCGSDTLVVAAELLQPSYLYQHLLDDYGEVDAIPVPGPIAYYRSLFERTLKECSARQLLERTKAIEFLDYDLAAVTEIVAEIRRRCIAHPATAAELRTALSDFPGMDAVLAPRRSNEIATYLEQCAMYFEGEADYAWAISGCPSITAEVLREHPQWIHTAELCSNLAISDEEYEELVDPDDRFNIARYPAEKLRGSVCASAAFCYNRHLTAEIAGTLQIPMIPRGSNFEMNLSSVKNLLRLCALPDMPNNWDWFVKVPVEALMHPENHVHTRYAWIAFSPHLIVEQLVAVDLHHLHLLSRRCLVGVPELEWQALYDHLTHKLKRPHLEVVSSLYHTPRAVLEAEVAKGVPAYIFGSCREFDPEWLRNTDMLGAHEKHVHDLWRNPNVPIAYLLQVLARQHYSWADVDQWIVSALDWPWEPRRPYRLLSEYLFLVEILATRPPPPPLHLPAHLSL